MGPVARGAQGAPGRGGRQRGHQPAGSRGARRGRGGRWKSRGAGEALASCWEAPAGGRPGGSGAAGGWDGVKSGFIFLIRSKGSEYQTMRTYTHGVIGYLLYAKRPRHEQRLAILGSILPDVFLALGFVAHSLENLTHATIMAAELHALLHHSTLHTVTVALHSFSPSPMV
jgi:hypothetical protein